MDLELTRIFVKVVQNGSFSRAAELLRVPKSTVSKSVSRLETLTGTKLLVRTTRSLTLTAAGRAFYDTCLGPIHILEDAQKSLHGTDSIVSGTVRITAPEDLGSHVISGAVGELVKQHPGLAFDLLYTDEVVDLVKDGFDMAVRIGRPRATRFRIRRLGEVVLGLVASMAYLKSAEKVTKPENLVDHSCITLDSGSLATRWHLKSKGRNVGVDIKPRIVTNQMTGNLKLALRGAGVALVPMYLAKNDLDEGNLVRVLPEWSSPGLPVTLVSPLASSSSARLKITADLLAANLERELKL